MRPVAQEISTHPDDQPALGREVGQPVDVSSVLSGIVPMLRTVVLDADLPFRPPHVDAADERAVLVDDDDLAFCGFGNPAAIEQQPRPGFLRRFGATVHQLHDAPQLHDAAGPRRLSARRSTSPVLRPVAFANASTWMIAVSSRSRRPRSNAVRAGVVTGIPRTRRRSRRRAVGSRWITMPSTSQASRRMSSAGSVRIDPRVSVHARAADIPRDGGVRAATTAKRPPPSRSGVSSTPRADRHCDRPSGDGWPTFAWSPTDGQRFSADERQDFFIHAPTVGSWSHTDRCSPSDRRPVDKRAVGDERVWACVTPKRHFACG